MADPRESPSALLALADESFVSVTTFRRDGTPVSAPMWVARDGDRLVLITPQDTGKVKRLRRDPRVELRPCSRRGVVAPDARPVSGVADLSAAPADVAAAKTAIAAKYGLEYRIFMLIERLVRRMRDTPRLAMTVRHAEASGKDAQGGG
ncbi:MAG TPA: PPOX class F420-dependent oxidoreductase [Dermatophilaceae bacterium]|nr:PPOX class F420-dependent oxidoreductase [Dermatophilaceae bacterium]